MTDEQEHLKQAWHNTILGKELCEKNPVHYRYNKFLCFFTFY
jgi:hypothetical protein